MKIGGKYSYHWCSRGSEVDTIVTPRKHIGTCI